MSDATYTNGQGQSSGTSDRRRIILVVDDDADFRSIVSECLQGSMLNPQVQNADCAERGLEILNGVSRQQLELRPDVIFTDLNMPGMNGWQFIQQLRAQPEYANTRIVVLSSEADDELKRAVEDGGADAFISKRTNPEMLFEAIVRAAS